MGMVKSDILLFFFLMLCFCHPHISVFWVFLRYCVTVFTLSDRFFLGIVDIVTPFKEKSIDFDSLKYLITIQSLVCLCNYNFIWTCVVVIALIMTSKRFDITPCFVDHSLETGAMKCFTSEINRQFIKSVCFFLWILQCLFSVAHPCVLLR